MKRKAIFVLIAIAMTACLLAACGGSGKESLPVSDAEYADYVGMQFAGEDPWGGILTITVRSIIDGKMEWTFTDVYETGTLYQEQGETAVKDGIAEYKIEGNDVENDSVTFSYQGTMELRDGQIIFRFEKGSAVMASSEGNSGFRMAEALADSGLPDQVVLTKAADEGWTSYTVKEGDSIHSIAEQFGTTAKELAIRNQTVIIETAQAHGHQFDDVIKYADYLFPGEVLLVPAK